MRLRKRPWADPMLTTHPEIYLSLTAVQNQEEPFLFKRPFVIEIGSGKGDFLRTMAKNNPTISFLGIEMQAMALAIAGKKALTEEPVPNMRYILTDIETIFPLFEDASIEAIFLNFSDPWPKKRQHKRRLTYPTFLKQYLRVLKPGGKLYFKTDNDGLFEDSVSYLSSSDFLLEDVQYLYQGDAVFDAKTEYEEKFRALGVTIKRCVARKGEGK